MTGELFTYELKGGVYEKVTLDEIDVLPDLVDEDDNAIDDRDFTKYIYRQRVQELLYGASNITNTERLFYRHAYRDEDVEAEIPTLKETMRDLFLDMKNYMKNNNLTEDVFWKVMLDDIYIVYKTMGTRFYHMYAASRKLSQGRQYTYAVNNIEECVKEAREYYGRTDPSVLFGMRGGSRRLPPSIQRHQTIQIDFNTDDEDENGDDEESQLENTQTLEIQPDLGNGVFNSDAVTQCPTGFNDSFYRSYHTGRSIQSRCGRPTLIRSPTSPIDDMQHDLLENTVSPYSTQTLMMTMRHVSG
jgi:hypothetical protein